MTETIAPKGRLEQLLDEFSDVHGTVLMGMHKELQTLKADIKTQVESQIGSILVEIKSADSELAGRVSESKQISNLLVEDAKCKLDELNSAGRKAIQKLELESEKIQTRNSILIEQANHTLDSIESKTVNATSDLDEQHQSLRQSLEIAWDAAKADIGEISKAMVQERAAFRSDAALTLQNMAVANESAQQKMTAAISFANKLNMENQALLQTVQTERAALHQKELQLQKRTKQVVIGVGLAIVATLGFWIWLTLKH